MSSKSRAKAQTECTGNAPGALPPPTDRGVSYTTAEGHSSQPLEFHVDYVGVTVKVENPSLLACLAINTLAVGAVEGLSPVDADSWLRVAVERPHGGRGYQKIWTLPAGMTLYASPHHQGRGPHCHLEAKGEALTAAGLPACGEFLAALERAYPHQWQATRLDLAWDGAPFTPRQVRAAIEAGNVRTWANRKTLLWYDAPLDPEQGSTCYLGSRQSERYLRVYNKRGRTRCELELKKDRARAVAYQLAALPVDQWPAVGLSHLRDFVDFVDAATDSNLGRADPGNR